MNKKEVRGKRKKKKERKKESKIGKLFIIIKVWFLISCVLVCCYVYTCNVLFFFLILNLITTSVLSLLVVFSC